MTFFKVNDPKNRELIKQVIAKRAVIREADRRRKMGDALEFEELSRFFKPITQQTERLEKGIGEIPGKIARVLPRPVNVTRNVYQETDPPPYEGLFAEEEDEEKLGGEEILPNEVETNKDEENIFKIGKTNFGKNDETKEIYTGKGEMIQSDKIYNILSIKNYNVPWEELNEDGQNFLGKLIVDSDILYENKETQMKPIKRLSKISGKQRWNVLYSPIWYNRFIYMDDERLNTDLEQSHMKKSFQNPKIRGKMTDETKNLIKE